MNRHRLPWIRPTILVLALFAGVLVLGQSASRVADVGVTASDSGRIAAPPATTAGPTPAPVAGSARATPRGKEIYKSHTLEEIRADPSLLAEILAESDYIRPVHGQPNPPLHDSGSDHACPNHVECPSNGGSDAFLKAQFALMEASGSDCISTHEGQMAVSEVDFDEMADGIGPQGGVLADGRGWVGTSGAALQHFGGAYFVAGDSAEHWFLTDDLETLGLLQVTGRPAAVALVEVLLAGGRTVWYLGPRSFASIPC